MLAVPTGKSVLLIDDSQRQRALLREVLAKVQPDGRFFALENGELGVEHLERVAAGEAPAVDLVLVDRQMPRLDGFEMLAKVRALTALATVPIIMVTGSNDRTHVERARGAGASDYHVKPPEENAWPNWLRDLLLWRPEFAQWGRAALFERDSGTARVPPRSPAVVPALSLSAMPPGTLSLPAHPVAQFFATAAAYFQRPDFDPSAMTGLFADPDEMDITFAERQARITRAQVIDRDAFNDHDMDEKRRHFFSVLFARRWALTQIHARFPMFSRDYLKRIHAHPVTFGR